jgi:acetyl esterase/lipase
MPHRIVSLIVICWLAGSGRELSAAEPTDPDGILVLHDLGYRQGPSKQSRLDLAMKKASGDKPRPAIVVIHGGGWLEGDNSSFSRFRFGLIPGA